MAQRFGEQDDGQMRPQLGPRQMSSRQEWQAGPTYDRQGGQGYGSQGYSESGQGQSGYGPGGRSGYGGRGSFGSQMGFGQDDIGDIRGPYRGRGPKGYRRSDERLKEDICERLTDAPDVDASEITLECRDGIVTLQGIVESRRMKRRAEEIVDGCTGVRDVENRLRIAEGETDQGGQYGVSNQNRFTSGGSLHR